MEVMFLYRGTKDIPLSALEDVYIPAHDFLHGRGMYFSPNISMAKDYTRGYKKYGLVSYYKIQSDSILSINEGEIVDGNAPDKIKKLLNMKTQVLELIKDYQTNELKLKTVYEESPNFLKLSKEEQDEIFKKVMEDNEKLQKEFENLDAFMDYNRCWEVYKTIVSEIHAFYDTECDLLYVIEEDIAIVKNPNSDLKLLKVELVASEELLNQLRSKFNFEIFGDRIEVPLDMFSAVDQFLSSIES